MFLSEDIYCFIQCNFCCLEFFCLCVCSWWSLVIAELSSSIYGKLQQAPVLGIAAQWHLHHFSTSWSHLSMSQYLWVSLKYNNLHDGTKYKRDLVFQASCSVLIHGHLHLHLPKTTATKRVTLSFRCRVEIQHVKLWIPSVILEPRACVRHRILAFPSLPPRHIFMLFGILHVLVVKNWL